MRSWRQVGKMLHRQDSNRNRLAISCTLASQGQERKEKVLGLGESVTEKEDESLPQKHRGGKVVVCLFGGKLCLPTPSTQPVVYLKKCR